MIKVHIKEKIVLHAISLQEFGYNDLSWQKEDAMNITTSIMDDDIGILGGDVYEINSNQLIPLCDNWYCEPKDHETKKEFHLRSKIEARNYIYKYPINFSEKILFSIAFTIRSSCDGKQMLI